MKTHCTQSTIPKVLSFLLFLQFPSWSKNTKGLSVIIQVFSPVKRAYIINSLGYWIDTLDKTSRLFLS